MDIILAKDSNYSHNKYEEYHLSILVENDSYSFVIINTVWSKYVVQKYVPLTGKKLLEGGNNELATALDGETFFRKPYKSVSIISTTQLSTIIPKRYFEHERAIQYLALNYDLPKGTVSVINNLPKVGAVNVFGLNREVVNVLTQKFPDAKIFHQATPFIYNTLHLPKNNAEESEEVSVNFNSEFIDIIVNNNDKLILYNSFEVENDNDKLYFIMLIVKQLQLNTQKIKLLLYGQIKLSSELYQRLQRTIRNVHLAQPISFFEYSDSLSVFPKHQYANLYNLYKCE